MQMTHNHYTGQKKKKKKSVKKISGTPQVKLSVKLGVKGRFKLKAFKRFCVIFSKSVSNCLRVSVGVCDGCAVFLILQARVYEGATLSTAVLKHTDSSLSFSPHPVSAFVYSLARSFVHYVNRDSPVRDEGA